MSDEIVDAVRDLTRVMIALSAKYKTKTEAAIALSALSIPNDRIAAILAIDVKHVRTYLARAKSSGKGRNNGAE